MSRKLSASKRQQRELKVPSPPILGALDHSAGKFVEDAAGDSEPGGGSPLLMAKAEGFLQDQFPGYSSFLLTAAKAAIALSISSSVCAADIWVRMRALPLGTTG